MQSRQVKTSDSHPIRVNSLDYAWGAQKGRLSITFAPGKKQPNGFAGHWDRDLTKDLLRLKEEYKINTLVSLLQNHEFKKLKIQNELEESERLGIKAYNFPIVDNSVPNNHQQFKKIVVQIVENHLKNGRNVVVHCMGGLGRAPTFAASCLIYSGIKPKDAILMVREARENSLTTGSQVNFLQNLKF